MIDLSHAIKELYQNSRVCPVPAVWQRIYDMLPGKTIVGWNDTGTKADLPPNYDIARNQSRPIGMPVFQSDNCRTSMFICLKLDFREHLYWASTHGVIEQVYKFIHDLSEDQWLHHGDTIVLPPVLHKPPIIT